jgi:enamine deaminase RidA (YjgF/YER057c/UK114 family)
MKELINPAELARPSGFTHGILTQGGRVLWLAGQDASGPDGRVVAPGDMVAQCRQVLDNLRAVVAAAGGAMPDIVKLNVFVTDRAAYRANLKPLGALFRDYFDGYYPAMALFEVKSLFQDDALIEIEGFAVIPDA